MMISREEALEDVENEVPMYSYEAKVIVNDIYDSRGTCGECEHRKMAYYEYTQQYEPRCESVHKVVKDDWYCADFKRKEDD